jgi:hypothetical protein
MASNYINISTSGLRHANALLSAVNNLAAVREQIRLLKESMDAMVGDTGSYLVIEQQMGLPGGSGQAAYNLVAGSAAALTSSSDVTNLLSYFGATR